VPRINEPELHIPLQHPRRVLHQLFLDDDRIVFSADNQHLAVLQARIFDVPVRRRVLRRQSLGDPRPVVVLRSNGPVSDAGHEGFDEAGVELNLPLLCGVGVSVSVRVRAKAAG